MRNTTIVEQSAFEKSCNPTLLGLGKPEEIFAKDADGDYENKTGQALWNIWRHGRDYASNQTPGASLAVPLSQESKYATRDGLIINRSSGEPIPPDEPIFIFRARDSLASGALMAYLELLPAGFHKDAVAARVVDFNAFAIRHPERMKTPDTSTTNGKFTSYGEAPAAYHLYAIFRQRPDENEGKEFIHYAMWHGDTTLEHGERQVQGFFFADSTLTHLHDLSL